jgi:hypothetical protein
MTAAAPRFSPDFAYSANGSPVVSTEAIQARSLFSFSTDDVEQGLNKIATLLQGAARIPTNRAADLASEWMSMSCERATKLGGWCRPHISSTEDGEIVFEWWRGNRNLTLYFSDTGAEYIEVWGPDIDNDMRSGPLDNWSFANAWLRLQS